MRNPYDGFISRLYRVVEFSMSELEYRSIETSQAKMQRGKESGKRNRILKKCRAITKRVTYV